MSKNVVARAIIEVLGSPKEHVEKAINMYIDKIEQERKKTTIKRKFISEIEEKKDFGMFAVFAELDLECEDLQELMWFCFDYLPTSVEIISPDSLEYDSKDFTDFLNDLQDKLHKTDGLAKTLRAQNKALRDNSVMLMKNLVRLALKENDKNAEGLSAVCGVPAKDLVLFLNSLEKEGKIKKDKDLYKLIK